MKRNLRQSLGRERIRILRGFTETDFKNKMRQRKLNDCDMKHDLYHNNKKNNVCYRNAKNPVVRYNLDKYIMPQ